MGSPKFFVPCSPPVRTHGLDFDLNLDRMTRQSGSGVRRCKEEGGDQPVLEVFVKPRNLLSLGRPSPCP